MTTPRNDTSTPAHWIQVEVCIPYGEGTGRSKEQADRLADPLRRISEVFSDVTLHVEEQERA